jgi:hypothetical protein
MQEEGYVFYKYIGPFFYNKKMSKRNARKNIVNKKDVPNNLIS